MKKLLAYGILALGGVLLGCTKSGTDDIPDANTGSLRISVQAGTRVQDDGYDPLDYCTICIYSTEGLIRRYKALTDMPGEIWLLGGDYTIRIDAGDMSAATFTNKSYRGEASFAITPGQCTELKVQCPLLHSVVEVVYDDTVRERYSAFVSGVCPGDRYDASLVEAGKGLIFRGDKTGYILLPEGETDLAWSFAGFSLSGDEITRTGVISDVRPGYKYTLTYRYSPDAGKLIDISLTAEPVEEYDDTIIFIPENEATVEGDGFDIAEPQRYLSGQRSFTITSPAPISTMSVRTGERTIDLLQTQVPAAIAAETPAPGVTVTCHDEKRYTVTFDDAFFATLYGGSNTLSFLIRDTDGGKTTAETVFLIQGVLPVEPSDYDLWHNTVTLQAQVLDPGVSSAVIRLREADGPWQEFPALLGPDGRYTATVVPSWSDAPNDNGLTVYSIDNRTGIFPGRTYACDLLLDGTATGPQVRFTPETRQTVPFGDMEDGSLSCFTTANTETLYWGSGNNTFTPSLCRQSTYTGMGGAHCARLSPGSAVGVFAAGNLFLGRFKREGLGGYVDFGQDYAWEARPTGLRLSYHAKVGTVDNTRHKLPDGTLPLEKGEQDISIVYVAIVDWDARHRVTSGLTGCSGMWSPDALTSLDQGAIIGYGILPLREDTPDGELVPATIPILYYDTQARPSKQIKLVIAASTSLYGDYLCGSSKNELYLDDFEWVY